MEHSTHFSKYTIFCNAIFLNFEFFKKMFLIFVFLKQNSVCAKSEKNHNMNNVAKATLVAFNACCMLLVGETLPNSMLPQFLSGMQGQLRALALAFIGFVLLLNCQNMQLPKVSRLMQEVVNLGDEEKQELLYCLGIPELLENDGEETRTDPSEEDEDEVEEEAVATFSEVADEQSTQSEVTESETAQTVANTATTATNSSGGPTTVSQDQEGSSDEEEEESGDSEEEMEEEEEEDKVEISSSEVKKKSREADRQKEAAKKPPPPTPCIDAFLAKPLLGKPQLDDLSNEDGNLVQTTGSSSPMLFYMTSHRGMTKKQREMAPPSQPSRDAEEEKSITDDGTLAGVEDTGEEIATEMIDDVLRRRGNALVTVEKKVL